MKAYSETASADYSLPGGRVESVEPDSPADKAGILAGDKIISLDGFPLRDVIDYQFRVEPLRQQVELVRGGELLSLEIDNHGWQHPGIVFSNILFDGLKQCRCNCIFCFVDQLPDGLRDSLYRKDDDYRLSFLHGNFVTLNNLEPADIDRIIEQRLGPLYVSVHATDVDTRARLMGCSRRLAAAGLDNLRRLGGEGIETHVQVVVCPGLNDGDTLERTIAALDCEYPGVASVGVVPVAVAAASVAGGGGNQPSLRPLSADECHRVIAVIGRLQDRFRQERGYGFVYAADEFFLRAELPLPPLASYDQLPQYENGVGIVALFREQAPALLGKELEGSPAGGRAFLLTGKLAQEPLAAVIRELDAADPGWSGGSTALPLAAENRLFGPHVTVTGLLGGEDVAAAARAAGAGRGDILLMPASVLDSAGERFLDGLTLVALGERLDCAVRVV